MGNDLIPYNNFEELSNIVLSSGSSTSNPVIKLVGEFTTALFKPVTDWKKLNTLETLIIVKGRQDAEVKKESYRNYSTSIKQRNIITWSSIKSSWNAW